MHAPNTPRARARTRGNPRSPDVRLAKPHYGEGRGRMHPEKE
jgi:hypothetical protein